MGVAQFLLEMVGCNDIVADQSDWYPHDWRARKQKVLERDDYICQNCGHYGGPESMMGVDVDFITPPPLGGTPELENLWTLCYDCHRSIGHGTPPQSTGLKRLGKVGLGIWWALVAILIAGGLALETTLGFTTLYLLVVSPPLLIALWVSR